MPVCLVKMSRESSEEWVKIISLAIFSLTSKTKWNKGGGGLIHRIYLSHGRD